MGSHLQAYTGVYIRIDAVPVEHFTEVAYCSNYCTQKSRFFSPENKFCSLCGAPAARDKKSDGLKKPYTHVPDSLESLWFSPASGVNDGQFDAWMPNFKEAPFSLSQAQAADIDGQAILSALKAFESSEAAAKALAHLSEKNLPHRVCFGTIEFYL